MGQTSYRIFATITPGLEHLLEHELQQLAPGQRAERLEGGLELRGAATVLWSIALRSRLAESLRVRLGAAFVARDFEQLRAGLVLLPWAAYLRRGGPLPEVRVTCHRSRLYHSRAVAQRVEELLADRLQLCHPAQRAAPRVYLRLERDRVQVSVDASGELLHRRGYRQHVGQAPLRETLAAAVLQVAGYRADRPLWDPFCGAGTIPLEALAMASGKAPRQPNPGRFAFELWPTHDADAYAAAVAELPPPREPPTGVLGSDLDGAVLEAAAHNARAAGMERHLRLVQGDFASVADRAPQGAAIVTNPPYGRRLSGEQAGLYRRFGELLRERPDLDPVHVVAGNRGFRKASGLSWEPVVAFSNRGLPVRVLRLVR